MYDLKACQLDICFNSSHVTGSTRQYEYKPQQLYHAGLDSFNSFFPEALLLLSFTTDLANMMQCSVLPSAVINEMHYYIVTAGNREATRKQGVKGKRIVLVFRLSGLGFVGLG